LVAGAALLNPRRAQRARSEDQAYAGHCLFDPNQLAMYNAYLQVWEMWKANVMQSIQNAGHLSRYIAEINNQITATNRQAWEQQQASYDRISRRFSEYTRGVDTYHNPVTNQPIQLPGGYGRGGRML
jgi:hypothetical protein